MSKRKSYRGRHRMRSHEQAHADAVPADVKILDHPLVPAGEPALIADRRDLLSLIDTLRSQSAFAYDSEFIGEETYYPRLCVVQVATAEQVTLIDALAIEADDLVPFWELLADEGVEKIVHAGQQDLEPVVRHLDRPPANIFDVQVAAAFAGAPYPASLSRLIAELIGPDAAGSVGAKFSQWDHRPLTPVQMLYAANDVRYLHLLRRVLAERIAERNNADYVKREFEELCEPGLYTFDPMSQRLRLRGAERLNARQRTILRALLGWRDGEARIRDVPPRTFVKDGVLFEIARSEIDTLDDLHHVRGLPRSVKRHGGERLLEMVRQAMDAQDGASGQAMAERRDGRGFYEDDRERVDALWHAMRDRCHERSIDPALVTSKRELTSLLRAKRAGPSPDLRVTRGWRAELLADLL